MANRIAGTVVGFVLQVGGLSVGGMVVNWLDSGDKHLRNGWGHYMIKLSEKGSLIVALLGALLVLVSMYLIPIINPDNDFLELALFILGLLLMIFSLLSIKRF